MTTLMRLVVAIAALAALAALAIPGVAAPTTYVSQGAPLFSFELPAGWDMREGDETPAAIIPARLSPAPRVISVRPPGTEAVMWVGLWSPPQVAALGQAREYLRKLGPRLFADPSVTYSDQRTVNGMQARLWSGTGDRFDRSFDFVFVAIQVAASRVAIAAFIGEPTIYDRYEPELIDFLNSIRRAEVTR